MKKSTRVLALVLSFCLLFSTSAIAVEVIKDIGTISASTVTQLADSARLITNTLQHNTSGIQSERYIEWQYGSQLTPLVSGNPTIYGGSQTLNSVAAQLAAKGNEVVAGLNGDFFTVATGVPMGIMVTEGILRSSDGGMPAVGFLNNANTFIARPNLTTTLQYASSSVKIDHINKVRGDAGLYLYTPDFAEDTKTSTEGIHVILSVADNLRIGKTVSGVVQQVVTGVAPATLTAGQMVLSASATGATDRIVNMTIGMSVTITITPGDARFSSCDNAIGGYQMLIENGIAKSSLETTKAPRTAVGVKSDGTAIFYTVDGRQADYSLGLGLDTLATRLLALGCVTAVNLDGGGSTNISAQYLGQTGLTQLGRPSDKTPRKCANYIFFANNSPRTNTMKALQVQPQNLTILLGARQGAANLTVTAIDTNYHTMAAPTDLSMTSSDSSVATVTNGVFTPISVGTTTVHVSTHGMTPISSTVTVTVIDELDSIEIQNEATHQPLTELSLGLGESLNLKAIGLYKNSILVNTDTDFSWQMTGSAASVTSDGVVTAGTQHGSMCYLVVAFGNTTKTIPVTIGKSAVALGDFETAATSPFIAAEQGSGFTRDADRSNVKYGRFAGAFSYDFNETVSGTSSLLYTANLALTDQPSYLHFWLKGDGSNNLLNVSMKDASGNTLELTAATLSTTDYQFVSLPVPGISEILGFKLIHATNGSNSGTFYMDQIMAGYELQQDITAPTISFNIQGSLAEGLLLSGLVRDTSGAALTRNNITVLWDGVSQAFNYEPASGMLSASLPMPTEGYHRITVEAEDGAGNYDRVSQVFEQPTTLTATSFSDIPGHWAAPAIEFLDRQSVYATTPTAGRVFAPDDTISRAEIAILISRVLKLDEGAWTNIVLPYADLSTIPASSLSAVRALYGVGIMRGNVRDGLRYFNPSGTFTRAEAFTLLGNVFPVGITNTGGAFTFEDSADIPPYAADSLRLLMRLQIVGGDTHNRINPGDTITRGMLAKLLCTVY